MALNKRKLLLACILAGAIYALLLIPNQRKIAWQTPVPFFMPPAEAYNHQIVETPDSTYVFYLNHSQSTFLVNESIFYAKKEGTTWTSPILLNVTMANNSVNYLRWAIDYESSKAQFHVFAATWFPFQEYCIWHATGSLDGLPPLEVILNQTFTNGYDISRPTSLSPAFGPTGEIYLSYEIVTGMTENINYVKFMHTTGGGWGNEEAVGVGNSPCTFVDAGGRAFIYSNLWTFTWGPQDCVDEWASSSTGSWVQSPVRTSAKDLNADPLVIGSPDGTVYLFYNVRDGFVVQTTGSNHWWSYYSTVIGGLKPVEMEYYSIYATPVAARVGLNDISFYYLEKGSIMTITGILETGPIWYFPPLDQVWGILCGIFSFIPLSAFTITILLISCKVNYLVYKGLQLRVPLVLRLVDETIAKVKKDRSPIPTDIFPDYWKKRYDFLKQRLARAGLDTKPVWWYKLNHIDNETEPKKDT